MCIVCLISIAPSPPVITSVTNISSSVVRVTWTRPAVLNGVLISYTITYVVNTDTRSLSEDYNGEEVSVSISCSFFDIYCVYKIDAVC